jgi:Protein of unknown function (DUF3500)
MLARMMTRSGMGWLLLALIGCGSERQAVHAAAGGSDMSARGTLGGGGAPAAVDAMSPVDGSANTGGSNGSTRAGTGTGGSNENGPGVSGLVGQGGGSDMVGQAGAPGDVAPPALMTCLEMVSAANEFIGELGQDAALRGLALMGFEERSHFKFTPGERPGVPLRELNAGQRELALALVATGLSERGFTKAEITRQNELVLRAQENDDSRDPLGYFLAVYGTPATTGTWAWHWEGHHLSLHFTLVDCTQQFSAPTFYGANPAQVNTSVADAPPMGTRNLGQEEDLARQLAVVLNVDANKRAQAIVANQLRDTPETTSVTPLATPGLLASAMSSAEQDLLRTLITEYANNLAPELAAERLSRIQASGLDSVGFLWSGSLVPGQAHYYRVQGPTFLIEYVNEQNNANHVHAAWRDFDGDYGRDVIAEHRLQYPH